MADFFFFHVSFTLLVLFTVFVTGLTFVSFLTVVVDVFVVDGVVFIAFLPTANRYLESLI